MSKLKLTLTLNIIQITTILISVFFQIYIFKIFSVNEVGILNTYLALINILANIVGFGISSYIVSKFSNRPTYLYKESNNIIKHIFITTLISVSIFLGFVFLKDIDNKGMELFPFVLTISLSAILVSIFQIRKEYYVMSIFLMIAPSIKFLSLIVAIFFNISFSAFITWIMFFSVLSDVILILILIQNIYNKALIKSNEYIVFIKNITPYGILNFCFLIYSNISIVLLGFLNMHQYAAYLSVVLLIINCILMIPTLLIQKLYTSEMYGYLDTDIEGALLLKNKLIKNVLIYGVIVIFCYLLIGEPILRLMFRDNYKIINVSVLILLISLPFRLVNLIYGNILSYIKFIRVRLKSEALINILLFILLMLIVPSHNYYYVLYTIVVIDIIWSIVNLLLSHNCLKLIRKR